MKDFSENLQNGEISVDIYVKILQKFLIEHPPKPELNLHQPIT